MPPTRCTVVANRPERWRFWFWICGGLALYFGALTVLLFVITGVMLLFDASWWFLLINPAIYFVVVAVSNRLVL